MFLPLEKDYTHLGKLCDSKNTTFKWALCGEATSCDLIYDCKTLTKTFLFVWSNQQLRRLTKTFPLLEKDFKYFVFHTVHLGQLFESKNSKNTITFVSIVRPDSLVWSNQRLRRLTKTFLFLEKDFKHFVFYTVHKNDWYFLRQIQIPDETTLCDLINDCKTLTKTFILLEKDF